MAGMDSTMIEIAAQPWKLDPLLVFPITIVMLVIEFLVWLPLLLYKKSSMTKGFSKRKSTV
jgi:ethanolamine transporter EutH